MARRRSADPNQPDLFSILDEEDGGDQSGDTPDRYRRLQPAPGAAAGMDAGRSARRSSRREAARISRQIADWPTEMGAQVGRRVDGPDGRAPGLHDQGGLARHGGRPRPRRRC